MISTFIAVGIVFIPIGLASLFASERVRISNLKPQMIFFFFLSEPQMLLLVILKFGHLD